jgi:hypothetical protein
MTEGLRYPFKLVIGIVSPSLTRCKALAFDSLWLSFGGNIVTEGVYTRIPFFLLQRDGKKLVFCTNPSVKESL